MAMTRAAHGKTLSPETALRQRLDRLEVATRGTGFTDITARLDRWIDEVAAVNGLLTVLLLHTSASLTIQENADPDVVLDLADALCGMAPEAAHYRHAREGADDMPAHIKTALTDVSLSIPVVGGRLDLGTWQGVFLIEHRRRAQRRRLSLHFIGEIAS